MSKIQRKISESSGFNLLTVYLTFILGISNTFVIARLLAPEEWALIILSISFISIAIFFSNLFPPNAQESIKYYIPHLTSLGSEYNGTKRNFIFHVYKLRLICGILIFLLYLLIVYIANFEIRLFEVMLIMSPIILCKILIELNVSVFLALKKFKFVFFVRILNPIAFTILNFSIFFFKLKNPLILITYAYLLGPIISCIASIIILLILIPTNKKEKNVVLTQKEDFYKIHKQYGTYLILSDVFTLLTGLVINLLFLNYGLIIFITYLAICFISVKSALLFSSSNPSSYISIFSEINYEKDSETYKRLFYKLSSFLTIFNCIIVAIMFLYIEFYILVIYSSVYMNILRPIQLFLLTALARVMINNFLILTRSTNNTKINAQLSLFQMIADVFVTLIALLFFDFFTLILFYVINSFIMALFLFWIFKKKTDIKLKLFYLYKPFLVFITSFIFAILLTYYINISSFDKAYINFFINGTIKFVTFIILFYLLIYFTKLITKEEFRQLVEIVPILNLDKPLIKYLLNIIQKFLPSKEK